MPKLGKGVQDIKTSNLLSLFSMMNTVLSLSLTAHTNKQVGCVTEQETVPRMQMSLLDPPPTMPMPHQTIPHPIALLSKEVNLSY